MSRRKGRDDREIQYVTVDVECPSGHRVGMAYKILAGPNADKFGTSHGLRFEESPEPTPTSGRVRGTCAECSADVVLRWDRVRERIEANERTGRHTDTMSE